MNQYIPILGIALLVCGISLLGTKLLIRSASSLGLMDVPNARSSHVNPTPRGGGLAIVLAFFIGCAVLYFSGIVEHHILLPVISGGPIIALVGWMDDRNSMSAASRLLVHFTVALLVYVLITRGFSVPVAVSFVPVEWPIITFIFSLFFVAWMINLYNFMDGIDGLAGTNGVVAALSLAGISIWQNQPQFTAIYLVLAFAVFGFLVFNWSPAKIFMGDSGSTFLGFTFAATALAGKALGNMAFVANVIILGCFIVDATYTLLVRLFQGKRVYQAHRDHAFQHAIQMGWSHRRVVTFYSLITVLWLLPLALGALAYEKLNLLFLVIAYVPLLTIQIYFKAGLEGQLPRRSKIIQMLSRRESPTPSRREVGL